MIHHLSHLVMMLLPMGVFAGILGIQWRVSADEPMDGLLWGMSGLTAVSGVVHGGVTEHHAHEAALLGWAMAAMCAAQLTWSVWLLFSPSRRVVEVGVLGNLGIIVLWTYTRLVGIPFGIAGGLRQRIGVWDATCTLLEVGSVLAGLVVLAGVRVAVPRGQVLLRSTPSM